MEVSRSSLLRQVYPIVQLKDYGDGNYEVIREAKVKLKSRKPIRDKIKMLSKKSLLRLIFVAQTLGDALRVMWTQTYAGHYPATGKVVKEDINATAQRFRRQGVNYLWFLEFQKRGAPHVHWLLEMSSLSPQMRVSLSLWWVSRIASSEWFLEKCPQEKYVAEVLKMAKFNCHDKVVEVITHDVGARNYVAKYAAKERQKQVPKGFREVGRFWGASRGITPDPIVIDTTEDEVEEWLVAHNHPAIDLPHTPKFLFHVGSLEREDALVRAS